MASFWKIAFQNLIPYVGPAIMLLYPLYASVKAIETPDGEDDSQWLTYWILYSLMALIELALGKILVWIPFYSVAKLMFTCWLVLPQFRGAAYVYEVYVRNYLLSKPRRDSDPHSSREHLLRAVSPEARSAIVQYISDNGSDSFTKTIGASKWMYKMKSRRSH